MKLRAWEASSSGKGSGKKGTNAGQADASFAQLNGSLVDSPATLDVMDVGAKDAQSFWGRIR
jgi:hypothetical protein